MAYQKVCRVLFKTLGSESNSEYNGLSSGIILENRFNEGALMFESGSIVHLSQYDFNFRKLEYTRTLDAFACLGILIPPIDPTSDSSPLASTSYLVLVTDCVSVGKLPLYEVFRIKAVHFVCLNQPASDDDLLSELRKLLSSGMFYFARLISDGAPYDLSISIQNRMLLDDQTMSSNNVFLRTDTGLNFLWNKGLMGPFIRAGIKSSAWLVSIICGSFSVCTVYCGLGQARVGVISRVSTQRPGTRFHVRGINDSGDVANFVETEQFVYLGDAVASHIQVRGTVPLFWEQPGLQFGSHKISLSRGLELTTPAFERHFMSLLTHYGSVLIVNLLGCKQGEAMLSKAYQDLHKMSAFCGTLSHVTFDYHTEVNVKGTRSLDQLLQQLDGHVNECSFFFFDGTTMKQCQTGILRINCVDCLDRTNAVQTLVGLQLILPRMLTRLGLPIQSQQVLLARFVDGLRLLWQQNGDQVSRIYAGTGALGSGRSKFRDAHRTAVRTIQHSFFDAAKQEAMQALLSNSSLQGWMKLVTGQYLPRRLHYLPPTLLSNILNRYKDFTQTYNLRLFVGTWNVNGGKHFRSVAHKHESVTDWLLDLDKTVKLEDNWGYKRQHAAVDFDKPLDMFVIGFEEIVDLTTSNIMSGSKASANQRDWGLFLQRHLNRDANEKDSYVLITSVQLVGICLFLFIRARLAPFLRDISTSSVKTGLGGTTGNKGGVAIRFQLGATSFCFVCSHFAAGQFAVRERNDDFNDICRRLSLANGRNILSHDYVFWCGDFNYRINLSGSEVKRLINQSAWLDLLRSDQLTLERQAGNVFRGFEEGPVRFAPTYKYDLFCNDYDTSEKARSPAWTDRVLWRRVQLQFPKTNSDGILVRSSISSDSTWSTLPLLVYNRAELKTSDHRPVAALFDVEINVVSRSARRTITLEVMEDYGPLSSTVQVTLELYDEFTKQPIPMDSLSTSLYNQKEFLDNLKAIGTLKHGIILSISFLDPTTIILVYANAKQANRAVQLLDGYTSPWFTPNGPQKIDNSYEVRFSARIFVNNIELFDEKDWLAPFNRLIEIAEREDAVEYGEQLTSDIFTSLPKRERVNPECYEFEELDSNLNTGEEEIQSTGNYGNEEYLINTTSPPKVPPRLAPVRPAPPSSKVPMDLPDVLFKNEGNANYVSGTPCSLNASSIKNSPTHGSLEVSSHQLLTKNTPMHLASSCLDLSLENKNNPCLNTGVNQYRMASSNNLLDMNNETTDPTFQLLDCYFSGMTTLRPPTLPPKSIDGTHNIRLVDDPFNLHDLETLIPYTESKPIEDSNAPLIDIHLIPAREAPMKPTPPPIPPRPKPS